MNQKYPELPKSFFIIESYKVYYIEKPVTKIGRSMDNDLILAAPHVSREHAELHFSDGRFYIKDLDSTGGTYVNGKKVKTSFLSPGDVVKLSNIPLVFGQEKKNKKEDVFEYLPPTPSEKTDKSVSTKRLTEDDDPDE